MKKTKRILSLLILPVVIVFGCAEIDPIEAPAVSSGEADFTVYVSLGNSLTMGIQGLGLVENHQKRAHPALIARQMGKSVFSNSNEIMTADPTAFVIPGWGAPGSPGLVRLVSLDPVTLEPLAPENAGSPVNTTYPIPYNNLAVSGFDVNEMLTEVGDEPGSLGQFVLRGQGTQVQQALALNPTFITLWAGANDVLAGATAGTPALMTSVEQFEEDYRLLIESLLGVAGTAGARPAQTAPTIVAGTIPSPTSTPFMTTIDPFVDIPLVGRVPLLGPDGPLDPNDLVTLSAQSLLLMGFGFAEGTDLDGDGEPDGMGPLPGEVILSVSETETVLDRVSDFNDIIRTICAEYEIPIVEINETFQEVSA
ncbi:MAG: hypothetical protein HKN21_08670, partial [Candidatus Eisenbacteria bacterium]|nr:hypothetical protein [Candidatus Eisenbacteria bacterium]